MADRPNEYDEVPSLGEERDDRDTIVDMPAFHADLITPAILTYPQEEASTFNALPPPAPRGDSASHGVTGSEGGPRSPGAGRAGTPPAGGAVLAAIALRPSSPTAAATPTALRGAGGALPSSAQPTAPHRIVSGQRGGAAQRATMPPRSTNAQRALMPDPRLILLQDAASPRAASFRVLRDNLLSQGVPEVILITSPERYDGRTTCAANLALAFAEGGGGRALLVEGNYRAPSLYGMFTARGQTTTITLPGAYQFTEVARDLDVATIPPPGGTSAVPFDRAAFAELIAEARMSYDWVVIDGPEVLGAAVAQRLAEHCDALLLVARAGRTTARTMRRAVDELGRTKAVGVVLYNT